MRRIILTLLLAVAAVSGGHRELFFNGNKNYVYNYEAIVLTGFPGKGLNQAGVKLNCRVEIGGFAQKLHLMKIHSPVLKEFNGIFPRDPFTRSTKLSQNIAEHLTKPVKFKYYKGQIGEIFASRDVPETVLNILRGILHMFNIDLRETHNVYQLQENGLGGVCQSMYEVDTEGKSDVVTVIKSRDLNRCDDKVSKTIGAAFLEPCLLCQQKSKHLRGTAVFTYKLKEQDQGLFIQEATGKQVYHFSPLHELHGAAVTEARQVLTLVETRSNKNIQNPSSELENRGGIKYRFDSELNQLPMHLTKTKNLESLVADTLQHFIQDNMQKVQPDAPAKFLQLIQHLRALDSDAILAIFKQFAIRPKHRGLLRNALPIAGTIDALKAIEHIIHTKAFSQAEAEIVFALMAQHMHASQRILQILANMLEEYKSHNFHALLKSAILAYGTLVQKYCAPLPVCPENVLQPLHDFAAEAGNKALVEDIAVALKALGNGGQPASMKQIMKFLPGFSSSAVHLPPRIQTDAVMALRNVAKRYPQKVQEILLQLFANPKAHNEVRIMASIALFETKPNLPLLTTVANIVSKERNTNLQLSSFIYSYLRSLAQSTVPGLHEVAAASKVALNILNPSLDKLGARYSKSLHMDFYNYATMSGAALHVHVVHGPRTPIPTLILAKLRGYIMGIESDILELGLRAEGLQEALRRQNINFKELSSTNGIIKTVKALLTKRSLSPDTPVFSLSIKVRGHEIHYSEPTRDTIQNVVKALTEPAQHQSVVRNVLYKVLKGVSEQFAFPVLTAEVRHIVPTCTGFPLELSVHSAAIANMAVESEVKVDPPPSPELSISQLLQSRLQINADIAPSVIVQTVATMGINTPFLQSGLEHHATVQVYTPAKFKANLNLKERNLKIESPPIQQHNDIFTARSQVLAVSRNIEDLDSAKKTPVVPYGSDKDITKSHFEKREGSSVEDDSAVDASAEIASKRFANLAEQPQQPIPLQLFCFHVHKLHARICFGGKSKSASSKKHHIFYQMPEEHEAVYHGVRHGCLYNMVGDHVLKVTVKPESDQVDPALEKVQLEVTVGEKAASKVITQEGAENEDTEQLDATTIQKRLRTILGIVDYVAKNESLREIRKRTGTKEGDIAKGSFKTQKGYPDSSSSSSSQSSSESSQTQQRPKQQESKQRRSRQQESTQRRSRQQESTQRRYRPQRPTQQESREQRKRQQESKQQRSRQQESTQQRSRQQESREQHKRQKDQQIQEEYTQQRSRQQESREQRKRQQESKQQRSRQQESREQHKRQKGQQIQEDSIYNRRPGSPKKGHNSYTQSSSSSSSSSKGSDRSSSAGSFGQYQDSKIQQTSRQETKKRPGIQRRHDRADIELEQTGLEIYELRFRPFHIPHFRHKSRHGGRKIKIHLRNPFSSSSSSSSSGGTTSERSDQRDSFLGDKRAPSLVVTVRDVRNDDKKQGSQLIAYTDYSSPLPRAQVYVVDIAGQNRDRVCADAYMDNYHAAKLKVRFGQNCQQYKVSLKVQTGRLGNQPALGVTAQFAIFPSIVKILGKVLGKIILPLIPGIFGDYQVHEKNPSHQASLVLSLASPRVMNAILRIPETTLYFPTINIPIPITAPYHPQTSAVQLPTVHLISEIQSSLANTFQGHCSVANEQVTTFNGLAFNYSMAWSCFHVLALDCSSDTAFMVLTRNSLESPDYKDIKAIIGNFKVEMSYSSGALKLRVEDVEIPDEKLPYKVNIDPAIEISKADNVLTMTAHDYGINSLSYDGKNSQIDTAAWMRGKTCGMCGRHDDEIGREYERPDGLIARDAQSFGDSWSLIDDTCTGACKVEQETITLNKEAFDSTCYSVHPVLRCAKGCSPTRVAPVSVGFHCVAAGDPVSEHRSDDLVETVDAHTACA